MFERWLNKGKTANGLLREVRLDDVSVNPYQPRREFDPEKLLELSQSIREQGLLQPIIVRRLGSGFELIAGERRLRASRLAGLKAVPAVVMGDVGQQEMAEMALVENIQREPLNQVEEAEAYGRLMVEHESMSDEAVSERVGKSLDEIRSRFWMLSLSPVAKKALASKVIGPEIAAELSKISDESAQNRLLERAYREKMPLSEVRQAALRLRKSLGDPAAMFEEENGIAYETSLARLGDALSRLTELIDEFRRDGVDVEVAESRSGDRLNIKLSFSARRAPRRQKGESGRPKFRTEAK